MPLTPRSKTIIAWGAALILLLLVGYADAIGEALFPLEEETTNAPR